LTVSPDLGWRLFAVVSSPRFRLGDGEVKDGPDEGEAAVLAGEASHHLVDFPSEAGWTRGRRSSASSGRIWTLDAWELNAAEIAEHALQAGAFVARLADQAG